jgi:hypothetical protein
LLVGVVERRADRVVDVDALGHRDGIVDHAQAPEKECLALEVIVDPSRDVVVLDVGARLPPLHGKEGLGTQRRPTPLAQSPGRFDPIGDPVPLPRDRYFVSTTGLVDGLREGLVDAVGQGAIEEADIHAVGRRVCHRRRAGPCQGQEEESQRKG